MKAREFFRQFIPPILLALYRRISRRTCFWEGVYASFKEVSSPGPGFNREALESPAVDYTRDAIRDANEGAGVATGVINEDAMLALLASVAHKRNRTLKVLDFGGGVGISYVHLLSALADTTALEYHIVELEWACRAGPQLYPGDGRIHFHRSLPETLPDLNIVYMNGVLPYVEDYAGLLKKLCTYRAEYLLLSSLPVGAFTTFVSAQRNIPGVLMPCWFFNRDEIVSLAVNEGYSLICVSALEQVYNQDNFPETLRLDRGRNSILLFSRR